MRQILVEYAGRRGQKVSSQGCTEDSRDTSGAHPGEQKTSSVGTTARLTHILVLGQSSWFTVAEAKLPRASQGGKLKNPF